MADIEAARNFPDVGHGLFQMALDPNDQRFLYITDVSPNQINVLRRININTLEVVTVAGSTSATITYYSKYHGSNSAPYFPPLQGTTGRGVDAGFTGIRALAFTPSGQLLTASYFTHQVKAVALANSAVPLILGVTPSFGLSVQSTILLTISGRNYSHSMLEYNRSI